MKVNNKGLDKFLKALAVFEADGGCQSDNQADLMILTGLTPDEAAKIVISRPREGDDHHDRLNMFLAGALMAWAFHRDGKKSKATFQAHAASE